MIVITLSSDPTIIETAMNTGMYIMITSNGSVGGVGSGVVVVVSGTVVLIISG